MRIISLSLFSFFLWGSIAHATLSPYSVTLSDSRPWHNATLLVEFTTTQAIPASSTITAYFSPEWFWEPSTVSSTSVTISVNGATQSVASTASGTTFGMMLNGQQVILTTPPSTTFAAGATFSLLYGTSGTWLTPAKAGSYPFSTGVKSASGDVLESGASYIAIIEGVSMGTDATNGVTTTSTSAAASSSGDAAADAGSDASDAADAPNAEGESDSDAAPESVPEATVESAPEATPDSTPEAAPEATPPVDLGGDEGVDAVDVAEMVLFMDTPGAEAVADFNGDGVVGLSDLGVVLSAWTGDIAATPVFDRFPIGPPLAADVVVFSMESMNTLRASAVQTETRETVALTVSTGETSVNVVDVYFDFDEETMQVKEIYTDESIISLWALDPEVIEGAVHFIGAIPGGFSGSDAPLVLIEFAGEVSTWQESVSFSQKSGAVFDDGAGTLATVLFSKPDEESVEEDVESSTEIIVAAPLLDSETHPDPYQWYADKNPSFFWDALSGDTGYSYVIDHEQATIPDDSAEFVEARLDVSALEDGEWMLHVRRLCAECTEGSTAHRLVRVDTTPPERFEVQTGSARFLWEEFPFLVFETNDTMSGVAYYEVEADGERTIVTNGPFVLSFKDDGWYRVSVTAVDRAGNRTVSETSVSVGTSSSFFALFDLTIPHLIVLLAMILGLFGFLLWRRRSHT